MITCCFSWNCVISCGPLYRLIKPRALGWGMDSLVDFLLEWQTDSGPKSAKFAHFKSADLSPDGHVRIDYSVQQCDRSAARCLCRRRLISAFVAG